MSVKFNNEHFIEGLDNHILEMFLLSRKGSFMKQKL
jgi:hypothetical protein